MNYLRLGIIGNPLQHSLSPALHNYLLEKFNRPGSYDRFETRGDELERRLGQLLASGITGFNVTIPLKQQIMKYLTHTSTEAAIIGAVNTVLVRESKLFGYNTDSSGFLQSLRHRGVNLTGRPVLIFGAGGAARAVLFGLLESGVIDITLTNRTEKNAAGLARSFKIIFPEAAISFCMWQQGAICSQIRAGSIVINCTPLGQWPETGATPNIFSELPQDVVVADMVYNPLETKFLHSAKLCGAATVDGLDMLIFQGVQALEIWLQRRLDFNFWDVRNYLLEILVPKPSKPETLNTKL